MFRRFRRKLDFAGLPAATGFVDGVSENDSLQLSAIRVQSARRIILNIVLGVMMRRTREVESRLPI
jgi:hypothetical protein